MIILYLILLECKEEAVEAGEVGVLGDFINKGIMSEGNDQKIIYLLKVTQILIILMSGIRVIEGRCLKGLLEVREVETNR